MNPIKKILSEAITNLKEDLSCSKEELKFLDLVDAKKKSLRYALLTLHISIVELKIEISKALGGI